MFNLRNPDGSLKTDRLQLIIQELQRIDKICKEPSYSLDTAVELAVIGDALRAEARLLAQCCS